MGGGEEYRKLMAEVEEQKNSAKPKLGCDMIAIAEARQAGFMAIPDVGAGP
jgi:hypothetical protein